MDRALDPELLSLALGEHEVLPSPEEVTELLAEAELALLLREPEISEDLIAIGWYLHAVASSKYALQTYGVERQRAAFKVAGHIFDLLLQTPGINQFEKLKYCFASQIAYLRSELDPNALAMYHREFGADLGEVGLLSHFHEVALSCGVAFLGFDAGYLYPVTKSIRNEIETLVREWEVESILSTSFGSAAYVALGTRDLMSFLIYGRLNLLERARERFQTAVLNEASAEDQISRWVAAHLLNLANDLKRASIWTALPPNVPAHIRKAFAMGHPRILTLWPPQLDLFKEGEQERTGEQEEANEQEEVGEQEEADEQERTNPLSSQVKRLFLSTPTSGGKTLLAQLLVTSHLATERTSVCYVAPTRSLCREIRRSLESRLRFVGKEIAAGLPEGDWLDALLDFEPEVEVMTPERLSYLIRSDSNRVLEHFGVFIFDEVHLVGEPGRGWTLEEDLAYLHYATQGRDHRIILMSAAVGNRHHFVQWMGKGENKVVHRHSPWRGPRRLHAIWTTEADWDNPLGQPPLLPGIPHRLSYPLYGRLDARISHSGRTHTLRTTEPIGNLTYKISADGERQRDSHRSTPFYRMLVSIIQHLSESGPVLVIESTRLKTVRMAKAIADDQEPIVQPEIRSLMDLVEARLRPTHPLWEVLKKGVAYHHGSLPSEIRVAIEEAVSRGYLKFLVATTTMTEGVNLPVKSVVVASQGAHGVEGYVEYITGPKLINAIGRAGRAAKETEGIVVLARPARPDLSDFKRLNPEDSDIRITSTLATEEALEALAAFEEFRRTTEDAVFQTAAGAVSDFLTFIWFVAAELEQLGELSTQERKERILQVLEHTLAWIQLSPDDQGRWLSVAELALARYDKTDPSARRRWAAAGTSISSASEIENIAQGLAEILGNVEVPQDPVEVVDLIIGERRLQRILRLPEAPIRRVYTQRGGQNRQEIPIPVDVLLHQWLEGAKLATLADTYFKDVEDIDFRFEQLGDFINDYFEIYFPWVFGTVIAWTNSLLQENDAEILLPKTIAANVRWGVGHSIALKLMVRGIQSRILALKIAQAWEDEEVDGDVHSWIRSMNLAEWQRTFEASAAELRNLLEFSRDQGGGVAVELITWEIAELEVDSNVLEFSQSDASLAPVEDSELSPIGIWVGEKLVGRVPSRDQADIQSLLSTGLILLVRFSASSGKGRLELRLVDPEA